LRDQGLLSRVLIAAPASMAGTRFYKETDPNDASAIACYGERLLSILTAEPAMSESMTVPATSAIRGARAPRPH
jgi:hypothetical protein